ncbi:MAG: site-specific DNA-methyltransferase, partial [Treponema sp.]|nr:site-specific DNA-methyltransferase [Treponema sp.]
MGFSISWDDVAEKADGDDFAGRYSFAEILSKRAGTVSADSHVFIEGDNYPALKFLLPDYRQKIDLIYIDPPYNTGKKSFVYNDSFSVDTWLSFMKRRLVLARELLAETGCIFIAIGQEELFRLKLLCDLVFGEENFINDFMWLHGKGKKDLFSRT